MMRTQYVETRAKHARLLVQDEAFWKQRAKMHWLKEWDMNTKFFHTSTVARGKVKKVSKLQTDDGRIATSQKDMCIVAQGYFEQLFAANAGVHEPVPGFDESMCVNGFNPAFYQRFWHVCGDDIFQAVVAWLDRGYFPSNLLETNMCLIPKCEDPDSMKDLRPISLCNVLYKMVSKLLAKSTETMFG
jgi:hypothetical protein